MNPLDEAGDAFTQHLHECVVCRLAVIAYARITDETAYCERGIELAREIGKAFYAERGISPN
jgi:hypothetical protein